MKCDVKVAGNVIGGRQGWAYIGNSNEIPVLKADMDAEQEYKDFKKYGKVRFAWNYHGEDIFEVGTLEYFEEKWSIGSYGACLSDNFGYHDAMELIEASQLPIVRAGQFVAIAQYTKEKAWITLWKAGRINVNCSTVTAFEPLTDEEMEEVKKRVIKWADM